MQNDPKHPGRGIGEEVLPSLRFLRQVAIA